MSGCLRWGGQRPILIVATQAPWDRGKGGAEWHGLKSKKGFFLGAARDSRCRVGSASRRLGVVLKALAELGLSVPGSAEPQLGVGRGEIPTFVAGLADQWVGVWNGVAAPAAGVKARASGSA